MHKRRSAICCFMGGAILILFAGCNSNAAPPTPAAPSPASMANARIIKALDSPTEMDFIETPLKDVVEALQLRHGIKIALDDEALAAVNVGPDTPITANTKGVSLNTALGELLQPRKLSYIIDNGQLLITTADKAKNR